MSTLEAAPVACSLTPKDYRQRIARMRDLTRDVLRNHEREDLTLRLYYAVTREAASPRWSATRRSAVRS